ncbi:phosphomannomutase/phosphoglucomutase [Candidatus Woesearchaeota archaeon]|nr:phosphomannomutase/phosphoglucomutase [Candidatus Woesearchaeota archaeon]
MTKDTDKIFKAYDIRGLYDKELDAKIAYTISRAIASFLKCQTAVVGRDGRKNSAALAKEVIKGLVERGVDVVDIGQCSTPMIFFASRAYHYDCAVMVTPSHSPKEYAGIKIFRENATPVGQGTGMEIIKKIYNENQFTVEDKGQIYKKELFEEYKEQITKIVPIPKNKPTIIFDVGNGMGIFEAKALKDHCKQVIINDKIDGEFPARGPNPVTSNLKDLKESILKHNAMFGVAFDGDADRAIFVDDKGQKVFGDAIIAIIAEYLLGFSPEQKIVVEERAGKALKETLKTKGAKVIISKTGHTFINQKLIENNALFGAEESGHFYFKNIEYGESTAIAVATLIKALNEEETTLSELAKNFNKYFDVNLNFRAANPAGIILKTEKKYPAGKKSKIDGLTITFNDWWLNIRQSNTEPLIRLKIEANTKELLDEKTKELKKLITGK